MMNINQIQSQLSQLPDQALIQEMKAPSGSVPQFLVMAELQNRQGLRQSAQGQQGMQQPQTTVAQDLLGKLQGSPMPQMPGSMSLAGKPNSPPPMQRPPMGGPQIGPQPQSAAPGMAGIGALPPQGMAGAIHMANGGVIKLSGGNTGPITSTGNMNAAMIPSLMASSGYVWDPTQGVYVLASAPQVPQAPPFITPQAPNLTPPPINIARPSPVAAAQTSPGGGIASLGAPRPQGSPGGMPMQGGMIDPQAYTQQAFNTEVGEIQPASAAIQQAFPLPDVAGQTNAQLADYTKNSNQNTAQNRWLDLAKMGGAIASGTSPYAAVNIGAGLQTGSEALESTNKESLANQFQAMGLSEKAAEAAATNTERQMTATSNLLGRTDAASQRALSSQENELTRQQIASQTDYYRALLGGQTNSTNLQKLSVEEKAQQTTAINDQIKALQGQLKTTYDPNQQAAINQQLQTLYGQLGSIGSGAGSTGVAPAALSARDPLGLGIK